MENLFTHTSPFDISIEHSIDHLKVPTLTIQLSTFSLRAAVSSAFACDIHPAAQIGAGTYLAAGNGVVIGETAVVKDDVTILQGVTLGGTGKVRGDRHPKIGNGVILQDGCAVLGNIEVSDGAVVMAKSIALKPVKSMARVSGVPAKVKSHR